MSEVSTQRTRIATAAGLGAGGLAFVLVLLDFSTSLTRTALGIGFASNFFDLQGRALLDGRWALPEGSLDLEGFVRDGDTYTYFPPFPALVRLPILLTTDLFDGKLTILSMAVAWVVFVVVATRLAWLIRRLITGREEVSRGDAVLMGILLALVSGGTTLTYDAGQPFVYHEVYLWATAGAVGAAYWTLRVLRNPEPSAAGWLAFFCLMCAGSRTTAGWAMCLLAIGVGLWILTGRPVPGRRRAGLLVMAAGAVPWLLGIALNLHKFGHAYMFPLEDQVWTGLDEHRREALEVNGGTITGLQFFTTAFMAYFRLDGVRLVDYFPFITAPPEAAQAYGGAFVDQSYRTASVTATMPLLLILTAIAAVVLLLPRADATRRFLRPIMLALIAITGGVMAYGYFATRYVSDFVPALVVGGVVGTALLCRWLHGRHKLLIGTATLLAVGTAWSIAAQVAIGWATSAMVHEGDQLRRYVEVQHRMTPGRAPVSTGTEPPVGGQTDELFIRGDCEALYLNTGNDYRRWVVVEQEDLVLQATFPPDGKDGKARLATTDAPLERFVWIERRDGLFRVFVTAAGERLESEWREIPTSGKVRVALRNETEYGFWFLTTQPASNTLFFPSAHHSGDWHFRPTDIVLDPDRAALDDLDVEIERVDSLPLPLCTDIHASAGTRDR